MIYLVTGVPGSGKTLYTVSTLLKGLLKDIDSPSGKVPRRLVVDGIPDLAIPHELMDVSTADEKGVLTSDGSGLANWFDWCRPGDVLLVDEVQRYWRPRGMGSKPPASIQRLETHRHQGVDLVLITQNPMLIDQNVRRLVGRHIHVRRLFGMARAVLYDWDGCSADVHRTKGATSSMWAYPKDAYTLYKSSELHTKQKQKVPLWLIIPVLALIAGLFVLPKAFTALKGASTGEGLGSPATASPGLFSGLGSSAPPAASRPGAATAGAASAPVLPVAPPAPSSELRIVGAVSISGRDLVVVASSDGRMRLRAAYEFTGTGLDMAGVIDGQVITPISGILSSKAAP